MFSETIKSWLIITLHVWSAVHLCNNFASYYSVKDLITWQFSVHRTTNVNINLHGILMWFTISSWRKPFALPLCDSISLRFNGHFPGEPGLGVYW